MEIIIFIGIQASGKSEFYKHKFYKTHVRLNLDMLKTRNREKILIEACLNAEQPFVIDNTNPKSEDRKRYVDLAKENECKVIGYYFESSINKSIERNKTREGKERLPDLAIRSTHSKLKLPTLEEGFDELYYVKIDEEDHNFIVEEVFKMINDKTKGAIYGVLIGDALGFPYEFNHKDLIPKWEDIEFTPPNYFKRTYPNIDPGTWSDDSAQTLCLLDSLVSCGKFDLKDFSERLLKWLNEGLWAVDNRVFDCGVQTFSSLRAYEKGMNERESGFISPNGKGNGALMRVMPIAVFHHINGGEKDQIIRDSHEQCLITHGHVCNQVCCALYSLWAKYILEDVEIKQAYNRAVSYLKGYYLKNSLGDYSYELDNIILEGNFSGGGYVVDSIRSVRYVLFKYEDYESVVKGAISLGNDTDTTAAIAGGLAGAYYGFSNIPQRFIDGLRGKELLNVFKL